VHFSSLATALEQGRFDGPLARALAAAWGRAAEGAVRRRLELPAGARVVVVGGATLGGSGKTPLAIACAAELAAAGARVAFVGHAYRARPRRARLVGDTRAEASAEGSDLGEALAAVGDEATLAARALAPAGVRVVVAPTRSEAVAFAARRADVLVVDGVVQTAPVRAALALLAVDAARPWGAGATPPCGDLRAPRRALSLACDAVVAVGDDNDGAAVETSAGAAWPRWFARVESAGARVAGELHTWGALASVRLGLLALLARPDRIVRSLERRGVTLGAVVRGRDHGPAGARFLEQAARAEVSRRIDLWLVTPKCGLHVARACAESARLGAPVATIDHRLVLCEPLRQRLRVVAVP